MAQKGQKMRKEGQDKESLEEGNLQETLLLILIEFALGFAIAWLDELEDDLASAKVIHSRQEQDQALEAISEKLCEARSFFEQLGGSDVGF